MDFYSVVVLCLLAFSTAACYPQHMIDEAISRRKSWRNKREQELLCTKKEHAVKLMAKPETPSRRATNPQDKQVLEDFYHSTEGANWANSSGWMKGDPCQDAWYGIYCNEDGRVLELALVYNLLTGPLPSNMAKLDKLQSLLLYSNDIQGTIPSDIFTLQSLQMLDLNNNGIEGTLPSTISMKNLTTLNLYANKIGGELPTNWNTPNLQILGLSSNVFRGPLPSAVSKLSKLQQLVFSRNLLTGSLPDEYGALKSLQTLWLFANAFENAQIPQSWSKLTNLQSVEMDGLTGSFPSWIGDSWTKVETLVLVDGYMTGSFPVSLCSLQKVQYLHIFNNSLTGNLPNCVCDLPQSLVSLELSDNQILGSIPECIGNLKKLEELYLSRNNISGYLPKSIGEVKNLNIIDVSSNAIVGPVPSSFAGLKGGTFGFSLCYNKLSYFEDGLESFFDFIKGYSCELYENPWSCPIPSYVPKGCQATCSPCNTSAKHTSCKQCTADNRCGWCNEGPNCLEGNSQGPDDVYKCQSSDWSFGSQSHCPT